MNTFFRTGRGENNCGTRRTVTKMRSAPQRVGVNRCPNGPHRTFGVVVDEAQDARSRGVTDKAQERQQPDGQLLRQDIEENACGRGTKSQYTDCSDDLP